MTEISKINPDVALASLFNDKVSVQTSANESHTIKAYGEGERPNKGLGDEFLEVSWNGNARMITCPNGLYCGSLLLAIYVKTYPDGRANKIVTEHIIAQCQQLANNVSRNGFFFTLDAANVITPLTVNLTTGYSTKCLNVEWRTT